MISSFTPAPAIRPIPLAPPPPPAAPLAPPVPVGPAQAARPVLAPAWQQPMATAFAPPRNKGLDPLTAIAMTFVGTPGAALIGAGIGFLIAGPIGAARGALLGASLPGSGFLAYEFHLTNRWWGSQPDRSMPTVKAVYAAFPLISAVGYGVGLAVAGATGAAWGTLIAAALPVVLVFGPGIIGRLFERPAYDPPAPVAPTTAKPPFAR